MPGVFRRPFPAKCRAKKPSRRTAAATTPAPPILGPKLVVTHSCVRQQLDESTALGQWVCTRPRFLAGQLPRFRCMRTNSDWQEMVTKSSKRLFRKEMRGNRRLCRGTCRRISQHAFGGKFGGRSNRDSTFVVIVPTPLKGNSAIPGRLQPDTRPEVRNSTWW